MHDLFTNTIINLLEDPVYVFYANQDDPETRFRLYFSNLDPDIIINNNVSIYANGDIVCIYSPEELTGDIVIYDILGQKISSRNNLKAGLNTINVNNGTGYYLVKVQADGEFISEKVFIR